ncbi:MAG TPA: phosphonate ABC transporter, permease protein PhnE [Candidatus Dormibacteraeota bacterium]
MAASATTERRSLEQQMAEAERLRNQARVQNLGLALVILVVVAFTWNATQFNPALLVTNGHQIGRVLSGFTHPDFGSLVDPILLKTLETIYSATLGTLLGTAIAIPISFLGARNLMRRNALGTGVYFVVRFVLSVIRAIPTLVWAIGYVIVVGIGPFPGVLALTTFSVGLIAKLFSEAIEAIDWGQVDALTATGANPVQVVIHGVVPQVTPYMVAHVLYTFEVNIHSSTYLGLVGAGGLGLILEQYVGLFAYSDLAMWVIVVVIMTTIIDYSSAAIRRRIV